MKRTKKSWRIPTDYQLLLHLSDIQHWKKLHRTIAEEEIQCNGFYSCLYDDKKVIVVR
jgi:hypothetical protein